MPAVLTVESMAQAGAILGLLEKNVDLSKTLVYFMGIDEAKFRRPYRSGRSDANHRGSGAPKSDRLENEGRSLRRRRACRRGDTAFLDRSNSRDSSDRDRQP